MPEPASYQAFGWICMTLFGVMAAINQAIKLVGHLKEKPIPADTYVTKREMDIYRADHAKELDGYREDLQRLTEDIGAMRDSILDQGAERERRLTEEISGVHKRVDRILEALPKGGRS